MTVTLEPGFLDGRVALVTGGARGIGLEVVRGLASHGASVVLCDLDADAAHAAAEATPGDIRVVTGDLTADGVPERVVAEAAGWHDRLDVVVNNAGYTWDGMAHKMGDRQFQAMLDIHLVAPFRILRAAAPHLREPAKRDAAAGREVFRKVVNVSSTSGVMGNPGQANYAAGKAGIVGVTKTLAREWGALRINVNAVAFGFVDTRLTSDAADAEVVVVDGAAHELGVPTAVREQVSASIPLGRFGTPEEAAGGVLFLCSPWSDFVHGQVLNVTGGQLTGMSS
ncbi:MAG: SDR family oxidoreductase [Patulibacter sp.]|nr:SDR family oxidoreductase [Patulibacter sp.]